MIQQSGKYTVRVRGRTVSDGGMLWLASSLSEIGFRVTGAKHVKVILCADDTPLREDCGHLWPRFDVLVDGDEVMNRRMDEAKKTVLVFDVRILDTVGHHVHGTDTQHRPVHIVTGEHVVVEVLQSLLVVEYLLLLVSL